MAKVRRATPADFDAMVAMGRAMHDESPRYSRFSFLPDRSLAVLQNMAASEQCLVLVAEDERGLVGMLLGFTAQMYFCTGTTAGELVIYVKPTARGGSASTRLIQELERWAREQGASEVHLGISTEVDAERTARYYQRLGYAPSGHTLIKRCA